MKYLASYDGGYLDFGNDLRKMSKMVISYPWQQLVVNDSEQEKRKTSLLKKVYKESQKQHNINAKSLFSLMDMVLFLEHITHYHHLKILKVHMLALFLDLPICYLKL